MLIALVILFVWFFLWLMFSESAWFWIATVAVILFFVSAVVVGIYESIEKTTRSPKPVGRSNGGSDFRNINGCNPTRYINAKYFSILFDDTNGTWAISFTNSFEVKSERDQYQGKVFLYEHFSRATASEEKLGTKLLASSALPRTMIYGALAGRRGYFLGAATAKRDVFAKDLTLTIHQKGDLPDIVLPLLKGEWGKSTETYQDALKDFEQIQNGFQTAMKAEPAVTGVNTDDINEIDQMDGYEFEKFVAGLLRRNGFTDITVTSESGDYGVDVTAKKGGKKYAVQCKCYTGSVGVKAVQEVNSGSAMYGAEVAVVITNSHFTPAAMNMARNLGVLLWNREDLMRLMGKQQKEISQAVEKPEPQKPESESKKKEKEVKHDEEQHTEKSVLKLTEKTIKEMDEMAIIGAGVYVFGEDIPMGKYDLKAISGRGGLNIQFDKDKDDVTYMSFGVADDCTKMYRNLCLPQGWHFSIEGNVEVEITKSKQLVIE